MPPKLLSNFEVKKKKKKVFERRTLRCMSVIKYGPQVSVLCFMYHSYDFICSCCHAFEPLLVELTSQEVSHFRDVIAL